jgi:hypothetical protein
MQTTTGKLNRMAFVSLFALVLEMSSLSACGSTAQTPSNVGAAAQATAVGDCQDKDDRLQTLSVETVLRRKASLRKRTLQLGTTALSVVIATLVILGSENAMPNLHLSLPILYLPGSTPSNNVGAAVQGAATAVCDEGCHALQRLPATYECDEGARALARLGITANCRNH